MDSADGVNVRGKNAIGAAGNANRGPDESDQVCARAGEAGERELLQRGRVVRLGVHSADIIIVAR